MLNNAQEAKIQQQIANHQHERYEIDLALTPKLTLKNFVVHPQVLRPEVMAARVLAKYLASYPEFYEGKNVLDMGCGSGIQGIVTAIQGATHVTFSDIAQSAVDNTRENVEQYTLEQKTTVVQGNLFERIEGTHDLIVFNHPFFPGDPQEEHPITRSMLDTGQLLQRFLTEAPTHLSNNGQILMPFFHLAGETNNPAIVGPEQGYVVEEAYREKVGSGLQQGEVSIYLLAPIRQ